MLQPRRAHSLSVIFVVVATFGACGEPPDKEMQQAQGAIDAARAAGADQYAREEFTAATDALLHANEATQARDYRLALNHALDSRERAQHAAREAADNRAKARVTADLALSSAGEALLAAGRRSADLEARRAPIAALSGPRQTIATAEHQLQEARSAFDRGDFPAATTSATAVSQALSEALRALDAISVTPARRGR